MASSSSNKNSGSQIPRDAPQIPGVRRGDRPPKVVIEPFVVILHNIPFHYENGKPASRNLAWLKETLHMLNFDVKKVTPKWNHRGFMGCALLEFGLGVDEFHKALSFARKFEGEGKGKRGWKYDEQKVGLYAWLAEEEDEYLVGVKFNKLKVYSDWWVTARQSPFARSEFPVKDIIEEQMKFKNNKA